MKWSKFCTRLDFVTDSYPKGASIKQLLQEDRGSDQRSISDDETRFPTSFSTDFLRNNYNKTKDVNSIRTLSKILMRKVF